MVDEKTKKVICTAFAHGKRHDVRLFKESRVTINRDIQVITDLDITAYKSCLANPNDQKKKSKKIPLTKEDKKKNQALASERVANENVIGMLNRFKIISEKYRNR